MASDVQALRLDQKALRRLAALLRLQIKGSGGIEVIPNADGSIYTINLRQGPAPIVGADGGKDPWFWIRITSWTAIGGYPNRFLYSGIEQIEYTAGRFRDKPNAPVLTPVFNTLEVNNGTTGVMGNGADLSKYPSGWTIKPLQGNPVLPCRRGQDCTGVTQYWVSSENAMPEVCTA